MMKFMYSTYVIVCSFLSMSTSQDTCLYKECFCTNTLILCENEHLQAIPPKVSKHTAGYISVSFATNQITEIPAGSLPPNLTNIHFESNPIATIDDAAFDESATTLSTAYFSNTRFSRLPNAFGHLQTLTYLSISNANISDWNDKAMKNIGLTLQTLYLDTVGITSWPTWIQYFSRLGTLTISGSSFSSLPDNALDTLIHSLFSLSLSNNRLTQVPKALSKLTNLQVLNLQGNHINDLSWLPHNSVLSSLTFTNNYISNATHLSQNLFPFASTLSSLYIDKNRLTAIPDFSYFTQITAFDFTGNLISDPNSGSVPSNLTFLDLSSNMLPSAPIILVKLLYVSDIRLSSNALKTIQSTDFHNQTISMNLGYNFITRITDSSFPANSVLQYLELNNNPLVQISAFALKNLPNLVYLSLKSTLISRLPVQLSFLAQLSTFDVSSSPNLVCTCMESNLTSWIMSIRPENVIGDCGHASIYTFFSELSSSCPK